MTQEDHSTKQKQLEQAIETQESLRGTVDDAIIDTTVAALRKQLDEIVSTSSTPEQQRKIVTVLFVDIVNSTQMIQDMDPEESMEILDVSLHTLADPVRKHGGKVNKFMGDGFLAVFGTPTARENDPEMAVRAALDIQSISENLARIHKNERGIEAFQVRVGINTGLIFSGGAAEPDDTIMGSTINLAARLEESAEPGSILVSKHTYQHIRGIFEMEQRDPVDAKGFPEPVETYRILRAKPRDFRLMSRGVEGVETRMVGRKQEMQRAQKIASEVLNDMGRRFITVVGEAGLGKSRFLEEFENWLNMENLEFRIFKGRATLETQNQPYALFRELFARQFEILDDDSVQAVRSKFFHGFQKVIQDDDKFQVMTPLVGHLLGYDFSESTVLRQLQDNPQLLRDRAYQHLETYFSEFAAQEPVAIFLDDIHWADDKSLDLLSHLCQVNPNLAILFITLSRPVLFERRKHWGMGEGFETIQLQPLTRHHSEHLVVDVLQRVDNLPSALRELIIENAEGNPYYIEEMIRMLVEDGIIVKDEPVWRIQPDRLSEMRVPSTLTGIIQARLDGLPKGERNTLQQASVVGRVFWDAAVAHINQGKRLDEKSIQTDLEILQSREMVFQRHPSAFSDALEYLFKHGIFREVTYETVLLKQRKTYHSLVANWLIKQRGERVVEMSSLIANHLVKAGRSLEAVDYFQQAAEIATSQYANEEAVDLYRQALDLIPEHELEIRFATLLGLENLYSIIGDRQEQENVLDSLEEAANQLNDQQKLAEALLRRTWFYYWISDFPKMRNVAQQTIRLIEHQEKPDLEQRALYALTWANLQLEYLDIAEENAQKALELAVQRGDRVEEGNVHNALGMIGLARGNYDEGRNHIKVFLDTTRESGDQSRELAALNNLVVILVLLGEYDEARDYGLQMLKLASELGERVTESLAYVNLAWGASAQRDWQFAEEYILQGLALNREIQRSDGIAEGLVWHGYILMGLHRLQDAESAFSESLKIRQNIDQEFLQAESMAGLSQALLKQGNLQAAQEHVEKILEFIARDENLPGTWEPLRIYWNCYQVLQSAKDPRKDNLLKDAVNNLQKRAAKIPDATARDRYLENVPWHRDIMAEWESFHHK